MEEISNRERQFLRFLSRFGRDIAHRLNSMTTGFQNLTGLASLVAGENLSRLMAVIASSSKPQPRCDKRITEFTFPCSFIRTAALIAPCTPFCRATSVYRICGEF